MLKPDRIDTLDGLRGYAIILVILAHFPIISFFPALKHLSNLLSAGYLGVDIFFALSGFLITRILLCEKQDGTFSFRNFYMRRILRIFPIYFLCVLIVGVWINWDRMGWVALYVSNYYFSFDLTPHPMRHTWSLAVEEHFYLIWPLLLAFLNRKSSKFAIGIVVPTLAIGSCIAIDNFINKDLAFELIYHGTNSRMLSLSIGSLIAYHEDDIRKLNVRVWIVLIALIPVFLYLGTAQQGVIVEGILISSLTIHIVYFSIVSVLLLLVTVRLNSISAATIPGKLKFIFLNPASQYIGKISYGMYLYHYPVLFFLMLSPFDTIGIKEALLLLVLFVAIPALSFRFIESPLLKLKKKFAA